MIQKVAIQRHGAQQDPARRVRTPTEITDRLTLEFPEFDRDTVWRWVRDTLACLRHLGLGADAQVIERLTREHLASLVGSPVQAHSSRAALVGSERSGSGSGSGSGGRPGGAPDARSDSPAPAAAPAAPATTARSASAASSGDAASGHHPVRLPSR